MVTAMPRRVIHARCSNPVDQPFDSGQGDGYKPFRVRVGITFALVAGLHLLAATLLLVGTRGAANITVSAATFAYVRGLMHALDFDHVSMIDNTTRKFVADGRRSASVGFAFSAGHSTVVIFMGILVASGASLAGVLLDGESGAATTLGLIGLSVSGLYLLLIAISNLAAFSTAWKLRAALVKYPTMTIAPDALTPRGPAARIMTAPLRRVRRPIHVYLAGLLFGLGFDTASTIGLLMVTAAAAATGASPLALLALPFLFAAAMTLGDTINGLMMLRMYESAQHNPARRITFNLIVTGISVTSAFTVGIIAAATLLTETSQPHTGPLSAIAQLDTEYAGYALAALFALIGVIAAAKWHFHRSRAAEATRGSGLLS